MRVDISSPFSLWANLVLSVGSLGLFAAAAWHSWATNTPIMRGSLARYPAWTGWVIFVPVIAFVSYIGWRGVSQRHITLTGNRLLISSLTKTVDIPLNQVAGLDWIQEPDTDNTPEAFLVLTEPTEFGSYIEFSPRSRKAFDLLRARVEAVAGR